VCLPSISFLVHNRSRHEVKIKSRVLYACTWIQTTNDSSHLCLFLTHVSHLRPTDHEEEDLIGFSSPKILQIPAHSGLVYLSKSNLPGMFEPVVHHLADSYKCCHKTLTLPRLDMSQTSATGLLFATSSTLLSSFCDDFKPQTPQFLGTTTNDTTSQRVINRVLRNKVVLRLSGMYRLFDHNVHYVNF
jgi:hypothetical protein